MVFFLDQVSDEAVTKLVDLFVVNKLEWLRKSAFFKVTATSETRQRILFKKRAVVLVRVLVKG